MNRKKPDETDLRTAERTKLAVRGGIVEIEGRELFVLSMPSIADCLPAELTVAERAVAEFLLEGMSNRDIAASRGTSVRTIANQVSAIFRKLRVNDRVELGRSLLSKPARKRR